MDDVVYHGEQPYAYMPHGSSEPNPGFQAPQPPPATTRNEYDAAILPAAEVPKMPPGADLELVSDLCNMHYIHEAR